VINISGMVELLANRRRNSSRDRGTISGTSCTARGLKPPTMLLFLISLGGADRLYAYRLQSALRAIICVLEECFRKSELSCDRPLAVCRDTWTPPLPVLMMTAAGGAQLSELNPDAFFPRACCAAYERGARPAGQHPERAAAPARPTPFAVVRFAELDYLVHPASTTASWAATNPRRETKRRRLSFF